MFRGLHLAVIHAAALLVPAPQRAEWLAEWRAELWYVNRRATAFCLGSICDAFWMNRNTPAPITRLRFGLESPLKCVMFLAGFTALSFLLAFGPPSRNSSPAPHGGESQSVAPVARDSKPPGEPRTETRRDGCPGFPLALGVCSAFLVPLLSVTPLRLGEYPVNRYAPGPPLRLLRWFFLAVKISLVVPMAVCGSLALGSIMPPLAGMAMFLGLLFGYRWALMDQRERCPVCLRLLSNPTRIGDPSQSFLGWYGTELLCSRGHGFLYIPGTSTSWCEAQRWQYLDPTWNNLPS
jgi:hypothetical protein